MRQFVAPTEEFIKQTRTVLSSDAAAGSNVALTIPSNAGFADKTYLVIGWEGSETAELCQVNAAVTPGTSIQIGTLTRAHKAGEPITVYRYNQRKFYGSLTAGGSYTELTTYGSPTTIQVNNPQGTTFEYSGGEGYLYFKSTYWNSANSEESSIGESDEVASDQTSRYCTLYAIKVQAGLTKNPYITDDIIENYRKRAENEINSAIYAKYVLPLEEVPAVIENACVLLAAGYMDYQEFGSDGEGVKWLGEARGLLKAIRDERQRLIGEDGEELESKTMTSGIQSYPNTVDNDEGPIQLFTMRQKF